MTRGSLFGNRRGGLGSKEREDGPASLESAFGIGLFIEEGAYTTVAAAVSILVVLTLLFSSVTAVWTLSRAGDVQASADATALAGANVISSYSTAATVVDASILSLGLAGFCLAGVGVVGLLVPGAHSAAAKSIECGLKILEKRNDFARSASSGLQKLEAALPYLVAANSALVCNRQSTDTVTYSGLAVAVPTTSASDFTALDASTFDASALKEHADALGETADELSDAAEERAEANEAAWLADCGRDGMNMQERAARLSGLSASQNPDYASSITWKPQVGLNRARAYYRWRYNNDAPEGLGTEAKADAAARHAFYGYALKVLEEASITEADGKCVSTVPLLPKNMTEIKKTSLYTDAVWPSTQENGGLTIHYSASCPGAKGAAGPKISLATEDTGAAKECEICRFSVGDVGKTPMASTSINNGFEYHLREFTLALDDYVAARNKELELEAQARDEAESTADAFKEAISSLGSSRPHIAPPGRYGCVGLVACGETDVPGTLQTSFAESEALAARGAVSAAVLAPDSATAENNVLSRFFSAIEGDGGGAAGLVNDVMGLWGKLLVSYGDAQAGINLMFGDLLSGLKSFGLGPVADWLSSTVDGVVEGLGLEAVDLSMKKPVLCDSSSVLAHADVAALGDVQGALRSIPLGTTDASALLQSVGCEVGERINETTFTLAEIPLPGGGSIPLTIKVGDIAGALGGA